VPADINTAKRCALTPPAGDERTQLEWFAKRSPQKMILRYLSKFAKPKRYFPLT